jgi:hypothetical protein
MHECLCQFGRDMAGGKGKDKGDSKHKGKVWQVEPDSRGLDE